MMQFDSSSARLIVHDDCKEDFMDHMAREVPKLKKIVRKSSATTMAIEIAIQNHPEWFEIIFYNLKKREEFFTVNCPSLIRDDVMNGFALMEASA